MTRAFEITLKSSFDQICKVFVATFAHSYRGYAALPADDFDENLSDYQKVIVDNSDAIYRIAARDINKYLQTYEIHANQSADEFKIIYFLGRAIEMHLAHAGYIELARVHMFTLIGLMDYRLRFRGIQKPLLMRAMIKLVVLNIFADELGKTGFYLTYKCVSTMNR